jgi:type IV secretory pathway TraG/TraD family ATPase VirD4
MSRPLDKELLRECFGSSAVVRRCFTGGYKINTTAGGSVRVESDGKFTRFSGADVYAPSLKALKLLHGTPVKASGSLYHIMQMVIEGQKLGIPVEAVEYERLILPNDPPPLIPLPSGTGIATDAMLREAGLTTAKWGEGLCLAEDSAGNFLRYMGLNSIFAVGASGVGKLATWLVRMLVESERMSFGPLLDPKCEITPIIKRRREALGPVKLLCPYKEGLPEECAHYADQTDSYDPVAIFLNPASESYIINADALSTILIAPDGSGESKETGFFSGNAQGLCAGVLMQLVENYPDEATLPEMASIICSNRIFEFAATAVKTGSRYVRDRLSTFGTPDAPLLKGGIGDILRTAREQLKWLSDPAIARVLRKPKTPWRFDDLKRGPRPTTVCVCIPPKYADVSRRFFRLFLGCAFMELQASPPGDWKVCSVADEFALLGRVPIFSTVFAEARGHGFMVVAVVQNVGQMITAYGREGFRNFLSGSEIQLYFPPRDIETAQEVARLAGQRRIVTANHSLGQRDGWGTIGYGEGREDVLTPHDVMAMGKDQLIISAPGLVKDIIVARRRNYWEYSEDILPLCDPNPYAPADKSKSAKRHAIEEQALASRIARWRLFHNGVDR